ncbi:MAG TPA: thioredoxin family protein [Syntrophorhabdales bacterium]|nr:thioredoxin family protein [Syntrophorhabdales bacterium]
MPQVEALGTTYTGKVKMTKVEAPKNRRLCLQLKVMSLPTYLLFKDGKEVERLSGNVSVESIEESIKKLL